MKQINDLMASLSVTVDARERINQQGFIEKVVFYNDNENYAVDPEPTPAVTDTSTESKAEGIPEETQTESHV